MLKEDKVAFRYSASLALIQGMHMDKAISQDAIIELEQDWEESLANEIKAQGLDREVVMKKILTSFDKEDSLICAKLSFLNKQKSLYLRLLQAKFNWLTEKKMDNFLDGNEDKEIFWLCSMEPDAKKYDENMNSDITNFRSVFNSYKSAREEMLMLKIKLGKEFEQSGKAQSLRI